MRILLVTVITKSDASGQVVPPTAYVIVAEPGETPVTKPDEASTVAIASSLDDQTPPVAPSEEMVVVERRSIDVKPDKVPADGLSIIKLGVAEPVHPSELVTVTVYEAPVTPDVDGVALVASSKSEVGSFQEKV
jgi:hypothetical protein